MSRPLFLGGSLHKTNRHIDTYNDHTLRVPIQPSLDEYRSMLGYWNELDTCMGPELKIEEYHKTHVCVFGLTLEVWIHAPEKHRMWALCLDALVSDYAKDGVWK